MVAFVVINGDRIARYARHPKTDNLRATHCANIKNQGELTHGAVESFRTTPLPTYDLPEGDRWHK